MFKVPSFTCYLINDTPASHSPVAHYLTLLPPLHIIFHKTCSSPRRPVRSHSMVCIKNSLFIVGIGPIRDKEL